MRIPALVLCATLAGTPAVADDNDIADNHLILKAALAVAGESVCFIKPNVPWQTFAMRAEEETGATPRLVQAAIRMRTFEMMDHVLQTNSKDDFCSKFSTAQEGS